LLDTGDEGIRTATAEGGTGWRFNVKHKADMPSFTRDAPPGQKLKKKK